MDARSILRRVGAVLIAVGAIDIAFMVYCITNKVSYSSSFNVFAVVAGLFLWFGHLGAVRFITAAAAFFFSGFLVVMVIFVPFGEPLALRALTFRQHPIETLLSLLLAAGVVALMYWIYAQLRSPSVLEARKVAGQSVQPPKLAFVVGALIPILLLGIMITVEHGEIGRTAVELAKLQVGEGYDFHLESWSSSGGSGRATVIAFNSVEVKAVEVEW
jgi:hypothetical protein